MNFKYNKKEKYIVAVSGGPDSMALLNMLYNDGYTNLIVCHVNYHRRKESNYEQEQVTAWAINHNLKIEVLDTSNMLPKGNFQAWARDARYKFFKDTYINENAKGLFVAHNLDDNLETYLLQKKKGGFYPYYGLKEESIYLNMYVYRPLLSIRKKDLLEYCKTNNVFYSIDSSNLENHYSRNVIRHCIVENISKEDLDNLLLEIANKNEYNNIINNKIDELDKNGIKLSDFSLVDDKETFIYLYLIKNSGLFSRKLTHYYVKECLNVIKSNKPNAQIKFSDNVYLVKYYDKFKLVRLRKPFDYVIDKPQVVDNDIVSCNLTGDLSFFKITEDSFPLRLRTAKENDVVKIGNLVKQVNRLFIDYKVPKWQRVQYPVLVDKNDKIVYLPIYNSITQKNIADKIMFVIKW